MPQKASRVKKSQAVHKFSGIGKLFNLFVPLTLKNIFQNNII